MPAPGPGKALCGAQRPNQPKGVTCKLVAGHMTDHVGTGRCSRHGGLTPTHKTAAERQAQRQACELFNLELEARDPAEVLVGEITRTRRSIAWHETEIALLMASGKGTDDLMARWMIERKHLADVTARALHVGVALKLVEIKGEEARQFAAGLVAFARLLGHDPASAEVRSAGREAMQLIAGGRA